MTGTRARLSTGKKLAFAGVFLAVLFLVAEGLVRTAGLGDPDALGGSPLEAQWVFPPLFRPTQDGSGYRPLDARLVDRLIPRAKAGAKRIFVFGESAVQGCGWSENGSFARALERRLDCMGPSGVTVVNCGVRAISARQVHFVERLLLERVKRSEGKLGPDDVFVFYVGNNEFLPINAERYREKNHGGLPFLVRFDRFCEHLHLYTAVKSFSRTLRSGLTPTLRSAGWPGMATTVEPLLRPEDVARGVDGHLAQVRAMVDEARAAGATPVLMTVATNAEWAGLEDPPEGWIARACGGKVPGDAAELRARLEAAEKAASEGIVRPGAVQLDRWRARLERAHVRRALGNVEGAKADFLEAYGADDPYHLRCLPPMNENVRKLAAELSVPLADADAAVARASKDGIPGYGLLYDQVHLDVRGAERVAEELHRALAAASLVPPFALDSADYLARRDALAGAAKDALLLDAWLGWGDDRSFFVNRAFDRYEVARAALDKKIDAGTASAEETIWAANGYALEVGGEEKARKLYAAARAKAPDLAPTIDANVGWLDARPR